MVSKPVYALLEQRLAPCKLPGTSITESGLTVSTNRHREEEIISFFRTDSDAGRNCLDMVGSRACDCLVFYMQKTQQEEKICLLELKKPANFDDAEKQILAVYRAVNKILDNAHIPDVTWMAFICVHRSVPRGDRRDILKELKRCFGEKVQYKTIQKQYKELGLFLRQ